MKVIEEKLLKQVAASLKKIEKKQLRQNSKHLTKPTKRTKFFDHAANMKNYKKDFERLEGVIATLNLHIEKLRNQPQETHNEKRITEISLKSLRIQLARAERLMNKYNLLKEIEEAESSSILEEIKTDYINDASFMLQVIRICKEKWDATRLVNNLIGLYTTSVESLSADYAQILGFFEKYAEEMEMEAEYAKSVVYDMEDILDQIEAEADLKKQELGLDSSAGGLLEKMGTTSQAEKTDEHEAEQAEQILEVVVPKQANSKTGTTKAKAGLVKKAGQTSKKSNNTNVNVN